jgi:hypothetical protein
VHFNANEKQSRQQLALKDHKIIKHFQVLTSLIATLTSQIITLGAIHV